MSIHNKTYKRNALVDVLHGRKADSIPVWMMRQAGRFLPDYRVLREKHSFFERCRTPELASVITTMPLKELPLDAAIIFSDILVVPQAMGMEVLIEENKGPLLPSAIRSESDLKRLSIPDVNSSLGFVRDAIATTIKDLDGLAPVIGFAGTPWTLACYMVEGKGSKNFDIAKQFAFSHPETMHKMLDMLADTTIEYLKMQVKAGVECVQLFDSWAGALDPEAYRIYSLPYISKIVKALDGICPVIVYSKGAWHSLSEFSKAGAAVLGIDWSTPPAFARSQAGNCILQGNLDPAVLLSNKDEIRKRTREMIDGFGKDKYIANLGHGILPEVPVEHARCFIETIKEY